MTSLIHVNNTAAFTVVTPNYLAHAYALRQSFLQKNEGCIFIICLIGNREHLPANNNFTFIYLNDLTDERTGGMTNRYNPFELSCALKPFFATHIFHHFEHIHRLIYLDGDIHVFGKFIQQSDAAITISPHRTVHVNYLPGLDNFSTTDILRYGVYNAGYFELLRKPEVFAFLKWWEMLLENHAYFEPDKHLFTDQLWLSAVHSYFNDVSVNKNPGYNTGFWNLIERNITSDNGNWFVNNEPLVFFHFSTYKIEEPEKMVNFDHPILTFVNLPQLKLIFEQYRLAIIQAGYETIKSIPYPFTYNKPQKKKSGWRKLFS